MKITRLDHLVLTVRDIERTERFYTRVLAMQAVSFAGGRHALVFGEQKINLHLVGHEFEPKALVPTPGSADLCFVVSGHVDATLGHLRAAGVTVEEGTATRSGALGPVTSVYLRDPDNNLIELAHYAS